MKLLVHIPEKDRIPFGQKIAFAVGVNMGYASTSLLESVLWMPVFNIGFGISPITLGIILMIVRGWDAFADPIMGNISDNTHTRWGRRRPYLFVGAITTALLYPLFWYLPGSFGDQAKALYLTVVGIVFFTSFTVWSMPYYGMQLELTPNYDERTRLTVWMALAGKIFYLFSGWFMALVMLLGGIAMGNLSMLEGKGAFVLKMASALQPWLRAVSHSTADEKPVVAGMRVACWAIVLATLGFGLVPALFVKERYYKAAVVEKRPHEPFWKSIRESFSCGPLWILIGVSFFLSFGTASVSTLGYYMNIYYVHHGDLARATIVAGWKNTAAVIMGIVCLPLFMRLGERYDKRMAVVTIIGCVIFGHLLNYFCMTPKYPYLQILSSIFETCSLGAIWMFLPSMKADVADYDEIGTKRRREGSINAFYSWFVKVAGTLSIGAGGVVLQLTGFTAKVSDQPQPVLDRMFVVYLVAPLVFWGVALAFVWFYPLTRESSLKVRAELEARRGTL